jgi:hypothetical protein
MITIRVDRKTGEMTEIDRSADSGDVSLDKAAAVLARLIMAYSKNKS